MSAQTVTFAGYTVGYGQETYEQLVPICSRYGKNIVVIGGEKALAAAKPYITEAVKDSDLEILGFEWYGGVASYENVDRLKALDTVKNADMIFAVGGGKAIDCAKCTASQTGKPFFTFPTIAATCASTTAIGVMYYPNGVQKDVFIAPRPAIHNLSLIRDSSSSLHEQNDRRASSSVW